MRAFVVAVPTAARESGMPSHAAQPKRRALQEGGGAIGLKTKTQSSRASSFFLSFFFGCVVRGGNPKFCPAPFFFN